MPAGRWSGLGTMLAAAALLTWPTAAADPRIALVDEQVERNHQNALRSVEQILRQDPSSARRLGLDYLRGHLLLLLDQQQEAHQAFATSMGTTPALESFSRYRLAREEAELGNAEVAAGLVATLLGSSPPQSLVGPSMRLLRRAISEGGDCRLLSGLNRHRFSQRERRLLALTLAECTARGGDRVGAERQLLDLLEVNRNDDVALVAATRIDSWGPDQKSARTHLLLGLAFHQHREFDLAIQHLTRAKMRLANAPDINPREAFDCRYALARSHFWQERYRVAAAAFGAMLKTTQNPTRRAKVIFQRARSLELAGSWDQAVATFDQAYKLDPSGGWADSALIGHMRLQWLAGNEQQALQRLDQLITRRKLNTASRALIFLASSDLVQGRTERAEAWLARVAQLGRAPAQELHYWQGRLEELRREPLKAIGHYVSALQQDPYHPMGQAALGRLKGGSLATVSRVYAARLASSQDTGKLYAAWLILGDANKHGDRARHNLEKKLWADQSAIPFLRLAREPTADWPLWQATLRQPEEMLLALGIFDEGASAVLRHFPAAKPELAFTGSLVLAQSGELKRSLYIAEILAKRIPDRVPADWLPTTYRRLLFPFGYSYLVLSETGRQNVDPYLLAAIIREESRFDPVAFSGASARGLTQFIMPTAQRIAKKIHLGPISPRDLEKPEVSIALGAAYLRDLADEFGEVLPHMVAAYNAGEPQAALWQRYCYSDEPAEYLSKVTFRETRGYVTKVLTSRAHYRKLYEEPVSEEPRPGVRLVPRDPG
ncbi:MAG: transglycosylase SLT domain-containing protein [Acidobacteriota bacterium]